MKLLEMFNCLKRLFIRCFLDFLYYGNGKDRVNLLFIFFGEDN